MTKEELKKMAVEPSNSLWVMFWDFFQWGARGQEQWDTIMESFRCASEKYRNTGASYLVDSMILAYLRVLQWGDAEGDRPMPRTSTYLVPKRIEEIIDLVKKMNPGDEVILKGKEAEITTRISE